MALLTRVISYQVTCTMGSRNKPTVAPAVSIPCSINTNLRHFTVVWAFCIPCSQSFTMQWDFIYARKNIILKKPEKEIKKNGIVGFVKKKETADVQNRDGRISEQFVRAPDPDDLSRQPKFLNLLTVSSCSNFCGTSEGSTVIINLRLRFFLLLKLQVRFHPVVNSLFGGKLSPFPLVYSLENEGKIELYVMYWKEHSWRNRRV